MGQIRPTLTEEIILWNKQYDVVIGIDEVGRGAFAGPLVVGAVVFPSFFLQNASLIDSFCQKIRDEVRDSKMLLPQKRRELATIIQKRALCAEIASVSVGLINRVGVGQANQIGFRRVIAQVRQKFLGAKTFLLVDGFHAKYARGIGLKNQKAIIKGDQKSLTIAAASIIAKVYRDGLMEQVASSYPLYQFEKHKGYGTTLHRDLLVKNGLSPLHRKAFCSRILHS